jgi:hypothetical protein
MSQPPPLQYPGYPPPGPAGPGGQGEPPRLIAILALVFGAAALLLGLLPVAGIVFGGILGTAAIVLGIIGLLKSHKVMSTIGIVLAVVGTIVSWAITGAVFDAADFEDGAADTSTTSAVPTTEPTTSAEPTKEPTTSAEPTKEPTTSAEPTKEPTTSEDAEGEPAEPEIAGIGDTVADGDFELTVSDFEQGVAEVGSEFLNEQAQGEFVIVDLTVKNIGSEAAYFSDSDQKLFDVDGNEYSANSAAGMYLENNDVWLTEINPGNQVEGQIVFDVPAGTELATLELHDFVFSGGVEVSLQ